MQPPYKPMLSVSHLSYGYDKRALFSDLSFSLRRGEALQIVGRNGIGKSTLFALLLGLLSPLSGSIEHSRYARLSYVPQDTSLNLSFPILLRDVAFMGALKSRRKEMKSWLFRPWRTPNRPLEEDGSSMVDELYTLYIRLLGLEGVEGASFASLSGGQRQKTLFLRALLSGANILLLDEPTSSLDSASKGMMLDLLAALVGKAEMPRGRMLAQSLGSCQPKIDLNKGFKSKIHSTHSNKGTQSKIDSMDLARGIQKGRANLKGPPPDPLTDGPLGLIIISHDEAVHERLGTRLLDLEEYALC